MIPVGLDLGEPRTKIRPAASLSLEKWFYPRSIVLEDKRSVKSELWDCCPAGRGAGRDEERLAWERDLRRRLLGGGSGLGFFKEEDFFEATVALGDDQVGGDFVSHL